MPSNLFLHAPWIAFVSLGAVVLAVTGCEALYADMGHFGKKPIQYAWYFVALPALLVDYFGQGAALLRDPQPGRHRPFSPIVPHSRASSHGDPGNHGRDHRQPGRHHRRFLHDPAGGAAGPIAAHGNPPHLRHRIWPDLCAAHECDAGHWRGSDRADLQEFRRAGGGLWHRRYRRDGDRHVQCLAGGAQAMALESGGR